MCPWSGALKMNTETLVCVVYDRVNAARIAAALTLAEYAATGADRATMADALAQFKQARRLQGRCFTAGAHLLRARNDFRRCGCRVWSCSGRYAKARRQSLRILPMPAGNSVSQEEAGRRSRRICAGTRGFELGCGSLGVAFGGVT